MQIRTRQDYYQIEWPLRTRKYEYGVYADEVLQHYFPPSMAADHQYRQRLMLLRAPAHCTGLSHAGRDYPVGADGRIEVEDHLAPFFLAHGFVREAVQPPSPLVGGEVPDIDALNRKGLFALLREKGVRVRLPITNDALREAARRALGSTADGQ